MTSILTGPWFDQTRTTPLQLKTETMKNFIFASLAVAAVALTSCSSSASKAAKEEATDFKAKIENCNNPDSIGIYVEQAREYADKLVKEGKVEEAKKYLADIQPVVEKKAPSLSSAFASVKAAVDKIPSAADSVKNDAADKAKEAGQAAVDSVKSAASNAAQTVSDKAGEAVDKTKDAASKAADKVADKASEVADKTKDKVNSLLN